MYILYFQQATYDPSQGYSPQPVDLTSMALSRELQVHFHICVMYVILCMKNKYTNKIQQCTYILFPYSLWQNSLLRITITHGAVKRKWSSKPRV